MAVLNCIMLLVLAALSSATAASPSNIIASRSEDTTASVRQQELSSSTDDSLAVDGSGAGRDLLQFDYGDYDDGLQFSLELRRVSSARAFQRALEDGVRHIVLTNHLDMRRSPSPPDILGAQALNAGVGRVQRGTVSIVGRCNRPAPSFFRLKEFRPSGVCAILVKEDFLDIPLGSGDLLLDSLYVAVAPGASSGSSVLLLHLDGQLWVTKSVFQGAGRKSRAIDVSTNDGGNPRLYVQDTTFSSFKRDLAPGIRVTDGARAFLDIVTFRNMEVLFKNRGDIVDASAIAAYPGAVLSLVDVVFDNNRVLGSPAGDQTVGVFSGSPRTIAYAVPQRLVYQWPSGGFVLTATNQATRNFLRRTVEPVAAAMRRAQQVCPVWFQVITVPRLHSNVWRSLP